MENRVITKKETLIQREIHKFISDPSRLYTTSSNRRLQVISPGTINQFEGPDFKDIAILLDGYLIIGDAEFHKKSSDWLRHNHNDDVNYRSVILHIVLEEDKIINNKFQTLVLNYEEVVNYDIPEQFKINSDKFTLEELQNYALHRLLRKTSDAKKILILSGLKNGLAEFAGNYIARYESKRNRHKYSPERLSNLIESLTNSHVYSFLNSLDSQLEINIDDTMIQIIRKPILDEGSHLRRELIVNAILPIALALADDTSRINLFVWYWSTQALNKYGLLTRKFPDLPQNFIWQQQGMLEYIRQYGSKISFASELSKEYGFAEVLSFYKLGRFHLDLENI